MFSISQIRAQARQTMQRTQGVLLLAVIPVVANLIYNIFSISTQDSDQLQYLVYNQSSIFSVVLGSLGFPLFLGILFGFLHLSITYTMWQVVKGKKEMAGVTDSLSIFQHPQFVKILLTILLKDFLLFLWSILLTIGTILFIAALILPAIYMLMTGLFDPNALPEEIFIFVGTAFLGGLALMIGGYALYVPQYLAYSQVEFILFEQLEAGTYMGAFAVIRESRRIMRGYKWKRFVLDLSFIGWFILTGLTFGLLNIYVLPYFFTSQVHFYQAILQDRALKESYFYGQMPQA